MNKYLQRTATLVETGEESFIQCEVCGRCYSLEDWDPAQVMPSEKYGLTCTHQDEKPGEPTTITLDWVNAELEEAQQIQANLLAECNATDWAELDIEISYREQCGWVSAMEYIKQQLTQ